MSAPLFDGLPPTGRNDAANHAVVRVALPVPIDRLFDYRLPPSCALALERPPSAGGDPGEAAAPSPIGIRVRVQFGGQQLIGLVVPGDWITEEDEGAPASALELSEIEAIIDEEPVVSESMMRLLAGAAREIFTPIGLALSHALPPGSTPRLARPWALTSRGERALAQGALSARSLGGDARPILERLALKPLTLHALSRALPRVEIARRLETLARDGLVERRVEVRSARARVPTERIVRVARDVDVEFAATRTLARAPKQTSLLRRIATARDGIETRNLTREDANAGAGLRALAKRGLVGFSERPRLLSTETVLDGGGPVTLTEDQRDALVPLRDAIKRQVDETFLLHGVTGSGKTEVYLRAIAEAFEAGRQALVLVPEITLTHQIVARLRARFGDEVAVLHSGLKPGERLAQWERLRRGQTRIAVGARSALFAPLESLGLIVIDEEHDGAYKNEEGFRYHSTDLATRRARAASCPLILGSATPSLETRHRADSGQIRRLSLPRRVGGRPLPAVEIVDLAQEKAKNPRGRKLILSRPLRAALEQTIADGGQTILFLNRRGFSTRIFCFQCGHAERCDDCDVALVFHSADYHLRCHYCDLTRPVPDHCNGCGDPETALLGVGTERLEEEVQSLFPAARTMRLDRDVASKRGHTQSVLRALKDEEVDIVIGTQMVAKGHDFPGVQLVGVVAADIGLHLPDFRAAERTFQLLTQVAGRAGRAARPGRVVVQTFVPEHYALAPVRSHDFEGFYREEIQHREALGYPPFGGLTRIVVHAEEEATAHRSIEQVARAARAVLPEGSTVEVLGPSPAPISKLRGRFRFMCLLKGQDRTQMRIAAKAALSVSRRLPREVQMALDARPVNML
ncbi:MAG: primosomal protein N' [bacterium]|nr:primosomal protein N' [bacterium]